MGEKLVEWEAEIMLSAINDPLWLASADIRRPLFIGYSFEEE